MSPRSEEFMVQARRALQAARLLLDSPVAERAISDAYYAMLFAARAALSEEDLYAKTHKGTWDLFRQTFVQPGRFEEGLAAEARSSQEKREKTDYDAIALDASEARRITELAERFLAAVEEMLG